MVPRILVVALMSILAIGCMKAGPSGAGKAGTVPGGVEAGAASTAQGNERTAQRAIGEGQQIFRYDTFGDEAFWGGKLNLHRAIAGAANGGVGPGLRGCEDIQVARPQGLRAGGRGLARFFRSY